MIVLKILVGLTLAVFLTSAEAFAQTNILQADYPVVYELKKVADGGDLTQIASNLVTISSVKELVLVAATSGRNVTMKPGVYQMEDYLRSKIINNAEITTKDRKLPLNRLYIV